jgi:hypothetical protein
MLADLFRACSRFYRFRSDEYDEQGSIVKRNLKNLRGKATRKVS